jgi:transposase
VKAYVKRNKNDAVDAEASCEAVRRPTMRFVTVKSAEQQGQLMQHRTRDLLMRQQTQVINALRAHLAELGIVAAQGREGLKQLLAIIADEKDERLPIDARASLIVLAAQLQALHTMIGSIERRLIVQHRANEASKRLQSIHGIGIIGASAIAATVTDPKAFRSGRDLPPGSGWCRDKIQPGANRSLGRFPSRATATCGVSLWSERIPCCDGPSRTRRNTRGWCSFWRGDHSRWWP